MSNSNRNRKGMTLVELLVYMMLAALVLTPVIMLVNNSSVNMARDAGRTNLQLSGREILQIMYDDLKNTGYKIHPAVTGGYFNDDTTASNFSDTTARIRYNVWSDTSPNTNGLRTDNSMMTPTKCLIKIEDADPPNCKDTSCNGSCCCNSIIKDSSSFYTSNYYLFTTLGTTTSMSVTTDGSPTGSYGSFDTATIKRYDTLGVRMGKLNKDGLWEGDAAYKISYKVQDTINFNLVRTVISPSGNKQVTVLAKNVAALKFRFSDNLKDWYDYFNAKQKKVHLLKRREMQYIKVILVLRDPKKLAATNPAPPCTLIVAGDGVPGYSKITKDSTMTPELKITPTDQSLYERYEIVVPIPNNGLYP